MPQSFEGKTSAKQVSVGIVASRFNEEITQRLYSGCVDYFLQMGIPVSKIITVWVPGAFEIPFACNELLQTKKVDGVVALGAVIQGQTKHFDAIVQGVVQGVMDVQLNTRKPIAFGVLTTATEKQALSRSGGNYGNKGEESGEVLLQLLDIKKQLNKKKSSKKTKK